MSVLQGLFTPFEIISIRETTLGGNQWLEENIRMQFQEGIHLEDLISNYGSCDDTQSNMCKWRNGQVNYDGIDGKLHLKRRSRITNDDFKIILNPMQIRTFVIDIKKK